MEESKKCIYFDQIKFRNGSVRFPEKYCERGCFAFAQPLRGDAGFVLVTLVGIIPIFVIAIFCILATMWFIKEKEQLELSCEKHALIAQQILIDGAYDLIDMNPQVNSLVTQKEQLEWELEIAVGPEKMAIAAQLVIVRARMIFLGIKQKTTIKTAEARAYAELHKIDLAIEAQLRKITRLWNNGSLHSRIRYGRPRMQVDPHYEDLSLPTYDFGIGYKLRQLIKVNVAINGMSPLPRGLTKLLHSQSLRWQETCAAEPRQEGGFTWRSYLTVARLW